MEVQQTPVGMSTGQIQALHRWGYSGSDIGSLNRQDASDLLDACMREGHKLTRDEYVEVREQEAAQERSAIEKRAVLMPVVLDRALDRLFSDLPTSTKNDEEDLRQELKQVATTMTQSVELFGRVLVGYKKALPYKKWLPFLEIIGICPRSAQRYMELSNLKQQLGPAMTQALESKGISLAANGTGTATEARKIAKTLNELATRKLEEKRPEDASDFGPLLTEDEQAELVQKAIETHRPAMATSASASSADRAGAPSVKWVGVQIADLIVVKLQMLDKMEDCVEAVKHALEIVRQRKALPELGGINV